MESLSGIGTLYHITTKFAALGIVQHNEFHLVPAEGTQSEENLARSYYLSTTRSKTGSYTRQQLCESSVILELDADKLATRYKMISVDYWGRDFYKKEGGHDVKLHSERNEQEERILCSKPRISNALSYIRSIHCAMPSSAQKETRTWFLLKKIALQNKIRIYFYTDLGAMLLLNTKKSISPNLSPFAEIRNPSELDYKYRLRKNPLTKYIRAYMMPVNDAERNVYGTTTQFESDFLQRLRSGDHYLTFDADLHNAKSTPYGSLSQEREALDKLVAILRKHKWDSKQFISFLYNKWKSK